MRHGILATFLLLTPALGQILPDETTRLSFDYPAFTGRVQRKIQARDLYLKSSGEQGQPIRRHLFVIFDPASGYFVFGYYGLGGLEKAIEANKRPIPSDADRASPSNAGAYISKRGITVVAPGQPTLGIRQSGLKASSLDDAERQAIQAITENILQASRSLEWPPSTNVWLMGSDWTPLLDHDFYFPEMSVRPGPVKVVGIAETSEGWEITLQGQYEARVTLSPTFQPLKAERVDAKLP